MAIEKNADVLIIDEFLGREEAERQGLKFTGVLGVLLKAKEKNLIQAIKPYLDQLIISRFRLSRSMYVRVLQIAGEDISSKLQNK